MVVNERTISSRGKLHIVPNQGEVPVRGFPITHVHSGFAFETHRVTSSNMWKLRDRVIDFEELLGYGKFRSPEEVIHHVQPKPYRLVQVVFARKLGSKAEDVGVVAQEIVDVCTPEGEKKNFINRS